MTLLRVLRLLVILTLLPLPLAAQPDLRQMSGTPLPVGDVPVGSVTVRVVKGALTSPISGHEVVLTGAGEPITVKTDENGRAQFSGLTPGSRVRATTEVAGERIDSQEFAVPVTGGVRLLLVATDPAAPPAAATPQAPAQPGTVALGSDSRIVVEFGDDGLNVFHILQIVNREKTPVQTDPIVFDVPDQGEHATVLQGSSPQAVAAGKQITVTGPFAPGPTVVQFAYTIPFKRADLTLQHKLPLDLPQVTVMAQKLGAMHLTSPQFAQHRDMTAEGQTYVLGHGPALKAGDTITLAFTGLPHEPIWPRAVALVLAGLILGAGAWASSRTRRITPDVASRVKQLHTRRDRLFSELTELEARHREHKVDAGAYQARRRELVTALEQIYAEIDLAA